MRYAVLIADTAARQITIAFFKTKDIALRLPLFLKPVNLLADELKAVSTLTVSTP